MSTVVNGLVGGLLATVVMTMLMMAMGGDEPPPTAALWSKYVGEASPEEYMMQGMVLHFVYGIAAGGVFVLLANAVGLDVATLGSAAVWGVVYGFVLFAIGTGFWLKTVLDVTPDREMAVGFLVFHLVYGVVLGAWVSFELL